MKAWNETGSIGECFERTSQQSFPVFLLQFEMLKCFPFFCTCSCIIQTEKNKTKVSGHKHNILKSWSHLTNKRQRSKYLCVVWSKITGNVNQEKCVWSESRQQNFPSVVTFSLELCVFNQTFVAMYLRAFQHPALHWNAQFHLCISGLPSITQSERRLTRGRSGPAVPGSLNARVKSWQHEEIRI